MKLGDLVTFLGESNRAHARVGLIIGFSNLNRKAKVFWPAYNSIKLEPVVWLKVINKDYRIS